MRESGLLSTPTKASPVTVYCTKDSHVPVKRSFPSTLEEPGSLANEAVVNGYFGFFKSVMVRKGQRYPPMVHVVLPSLKDSLNNRQQLSYNRQLIESNRRLFEKGREIECKRNRAVETSIWSIHCDTTRFADYKAADLQAFDKTGQRSITRASAPTCRFRPMPRAQDR